MEFENEYLERLINTFHAFSVEGFNIFALGSDQLLHLVCTCPNKDFARAICAMLEIAKKAQNLQFLEAEITSQCYLVPRILANGSLVMVASLLDEVVWKNGEEVVYDKLDLRLGSLEYECFVHQFVSEPYTREGMENE